MKLVTFSVQNYRSITSARNIGIGNLTVLVGQNNEGKSNILNALVTAMEIIRFHAHYGDRASRQGIYRNRYAEIYDWERDFPIGLQDTKPKSDSIFRLEFSLGMDEVDTFKAEIGSRLNGLLLIEIRAPRAGEASIHVVKTGKNTTSLANKSARIAAFIGSRININYIPAIRTEQTSLDVIDSMLTRELRKLEDNDEYKKALAKIAELQDPILTKMSTEVTKVMQSFLPQVKEISISISQRSRSSALSRASQITVDDGTPTPISRKGDGIKSLAAISLLQQIGDSSGYASILAIEEPESHLHPSAIHRLKEVIDKISAKRQVVITTHCPLLVDRVSCANNIIISNNKAKPANKVADIRDVLGVRVSDNLQHAAMVLVVEGEDDKIILEALFAECSEMLQDAIQNQMLVVDYVGGAGNLSYKLHELKNGLCNYHVYFDNDDAGRQATDKAMEVELLTLTDLTMCICNGMKDSEMEDCVNVSIYSQQFQEKFGIQLDAKSFRGNEKWSVKARNVFLSTGKPWNDRIEKQAKLAVANSVKGKPKEAFNIHKDSSLRGLIKALEEKIQAMNYQAE